MLQKFEVSGYKGFESNFVLDFTGVRNYSFNEDAVAKNTIKTAIIYGMNGVGKSNLTHAIFDLVYQFKDLREDIKSTLTDSQYYLNAHNIRQSASFKYHFKFGDHTLIYEYSKKNHRQLIKEKLTINNKVYIKLNRDKTSQAEVSLQGAETLNTDFSMANSALSVVAYVHNNSILPNNPINSVFKEFIQFIKGMLFFRSVLEGNSFIGFEESNVNLCEDIVKNGRIEEFENFLNENGVECTLKAMQTSQGQDIGFDFGHNVIPFSSIASTGTKSLCLFFFWKQRMEKCSLVCIDEFDAFYHHELSETLVKMLKKLPAQVILTTHNTSIMSNDLLRPDCYFLMDKTSIVALSNLTDKELRKAHNLEKIYKSNAFSMR